MTSPDMASAVGHTPAPWAMSNGNLIRVSGPSLTEGWARPVVVCGVHRIGRDRNGPDADRLALANAAFIVRACNAHYELLEALGLAIAYLSEVPHEPAQKIAMAYAKATGAK